MKRGTKLYLVDPDGGTVGPFKWTLVREWFALGLLTTESWIFVPGEESWRSLSEFQDLQTLSPSLSRPESTISYYKSVERYICPSTPLQDTYLRVLGCPFPATSLDRHLANHIISELVEEFPDRVDIDLQNDLNKESDEMAPWKEDQATEAQIEYLESLEITIPPNLSKGKASELIQQNIA